MTLLPERGRRQAASTGEMLQPGRVGRVAADNGEKFAYLFGVGWGVAVTGEAFACVERDEMTVVRDFGI